MKFKNIKSLVIAGMMIFACGSVFAQYANTIYFMKGVPERSSANPAFQPDYNFWIDIPVLPNLYLNLGNNALSYNLLFPDNLFFMNMNANENYNSKFLDKLPPTTRLNLDVSLDLLGFGFKARKSYWNFNLSFKTMANIFLPKDLFALPLHGLRGEEDGSPKTFDLSSFGFDGISYLETGLGWSYQITDRLSVGVKGKYLVGLVNAGTDIDNFKLTTGLWEWQVQASGKVHSTIPVIDIPINEQNEIDFDNISEPSFDNIPQLVSNVLQNWGLAADLGVSYEVIDNLTLSAAVTDLGFINWKQGAIETSMDNFVFKYEGSDFEIDSDKEIGDYFQEIGEKAEEDFKASLKNPSKKGYTTKLHTRLNVGAEYAPFNDKLGIGLLYSRVITPSGSFNDLTASLNWRPCRWFNPALSYSILDNGFHTIGAGLQMKFGPWVTYIAVDYIPIGTDPKVFTKEFIPKYMKGVNLQGGLVLAFGGGKGNKDDDSDGVKNSKDKCPFTPLGYLVDKKGCTIDTDKDGVADNVDLCPETPIGVQVDEHGCPIDSDGDGIPDYLDKCPDTPEAARGFVDENGCPIDSDGDEVPDYLDKCPGTPEAARGFVDENGCPKDSDSDGVADYLDKCPNTPEGAPVDENGCPIDSDGDGVPDYLDKCPNTPAEAYGNVDENGCPIDTDGDGVPNYKDDCPTIFGVASNKGCPEVKAAVKQLFKKALNGIQFQSGKATIKATSNPILNQIVKVMQDNSDYYLTISGHTDNVGKPESNQKLSEERAAAVKTYLVDHGIAANRLTSLGFGDTQPIESNKTAAGRAKNRRVDIEVKFEAFVEPAVK
jgi:outer membrane protein OmpA-like peptidoglycan-associated protein